MYTVMNLYKQVNYETYSYSIAGNDNYNDNKLYDID